MHRSKQPHKRAKCETKSVNREAIALTLGRRSPRINRVIFWLCQAPASCLGRKNYT
jgi:hypothetical protein